MHALYLKATEDTPEVFLDKENNTFRIQGNSFSDNPITSFRPLFEWINEYIEDPNDETIFEFKIYYMNTSSSKQMTIFIKKLEEISDKKTVKVKWFYDVMDEDMEFEGETLKSMVKVDFELVKM